MRLRLLIAAASVAALTACGDAVSTGPEQEAHYGWFGAAGSGACGIRDGNAWCARGISGDYEPVLDGTPVREFAFGWDHVCALAEDGDVHCWRSWGRDWPSNYPRPHPPESEAAAPRYTQIAVQDEHGCGLSTEGTIWCWGADYAFRGIFGRPVRDLPEWCYDGGRRCDYAAEMPAPVRFSAFGLSRAHGCGLAAGEIWCWGDSSGGALGRSDDEGAIECGKPVCGFPPRPVAASVRFEQLAVTPGGGCGLTGSGRAWCWGAGGATPMPVPGVFDVLTGGVQACALANRRANCWAPAGDGHGVTDSSAVVPRQVPEFLFDRLLPSLGYSCGSNQVTGVVCWGGDGIPSIVPGQRPM